MLETKHGSPVGTAQEHRYHLAAGPLLQSESIYSYCLFLSFSHCHFHPPPLHHGRTLSSGSSVAVPGCLVLNTGEGSVGSIPCLSECNPPPTHTHTTFPKQTIHYLSSAFLQCSGFILAITYINLFYLHLLPRLKIGQCYLPVCSVYVGVGGEAALAHVGTLAVRGQHQPVTPSLHFIHILF